jgi:hypothetical protein
MLGAPWHRRCWLWARTGSAWTCGTPTATSRRRSPRRRVRRRCTRWSRSGSMRSTTASPSRRSSPGRRPDWPATRWSSPSTATTAATSGRRRGTGPTGSGRPGCSRWPCSAAPRPVLRGVDHPLAHPDLAHHRGHSAADPLRAQRRVPGDHRGCATLPGIVEEAWPSLEHVTDPMLFFCADGDPDKMTANITQMIEEITAFTDLDTMRSVTMSEWILKS